MKLAANLAVAPPYSVAVVDTPTAAELAEEALARTAADMLPADQYDEFVLVAQLPGQPGPIYWPVSQVCEPGRMDWTEVPRPDQPLSQLKSPAAVLELLPAAGAHGGHMH